MIDFWTSTQTWMQSAYNTMWCLIGCAIGDFGTIAYFQLTGIPWPVLAIMSLAIVNGLITSILLETIILLSKKFSFNDALKTALGMSFLSMIAMEVAMNTTDWLITGSAKLTVVAVIAALFVGFITPWPYNYWRLKKFGRACH